MSGGATERDDFDLKREKKGVSLLTFNCGLESETLTLLFFHENNPLFDVLLVTSLLLDRIVDDVIPVSWTFCALIPPTELTEDDPVPVPVPVPVVVTVTDNSFNGLGQIVLKMCIIVSQ